MMKTAEYFQGIDPAAAVGIVHNGWRGFVLPRKRFSLRPLRLCVEK
jgi:hypothetical protein